MGKLQWADRNLGGLYAHPKAKPIKFPNGLLARRLAPRITPPQQDQGKDETKGVTA